MTVGPSWFIVDNSETWPSPVRTPELYFFISLILLEHQLVVEKTTNFN